jgi:hypothetical protein
MMGNASNFGYSGPEQFRPLSAWAYFGYTLLFCIPVVGLICLIVFSFSSKNINRRSFARSYWCAIVLVGIVYAILLAAGVLSGVDLSALQQVLMSR